MKIIVAHQSCDLDAITSAWLLKRFVPGWEEAELRFVPAGDKLPGNYTERGGVVELVDGHEVIHVDTGMGALDHHQTQDREVCAASITFEYIKSQPNNTLTKNHHKTDAVARIVDLIVDNDQFQEVFYPDPNSDLYELSLESILDGYRMEHPQEDAQCANFVMECLDAIIHNMENRIWAEEEIKEKGQEFETKWGKALAVETMNDDVLKLAQKMGYVVVVRKDPHNGKLRIKARPMLRIKYQEKNSSNFKEIDIDLSPVYEKVKVMDTDASWFLHASKRMLLNGSSKNPTMKGTKITLDEVVNVLKNI